MDVEKVCDEVKQELSYGSHILDSPASDGRNRYEYSKDKSSSILCGSVYDISSSSLIKSTLVSELLTSHGVLKNGFLEYCPLNNSYSEYGSADNLSPSSFLGVYSIQSLANWNSLEEDDDDWGEYKCGWDLCEVTFNYRKELAHHVNNFHINQDENSLYRCLWNGCARHGKAISARYRMLIHMRTHTHEKPHACDVCGKKFSRLENLRIHNRSHTGEKPYVCPVEGCGKAYSNSSDRFKHSKTHQEDKPYVCRVEGCNKRYTDPSSLRKHMKSTAHGGESCQKPHVPGQLGSHYIEIINGEKQNSETLLKIPRLSDTLLKSTQSKVYDGYRPYACREEGCGKRYTDPGSLRKHQRTTSHGRSGNTLKGRTSVWKPFKVQPINREEDTQDTRSSSPESPSSSIMEFTKEKTDISSIDISRYRTDELCSEAPPVMDAEDLIPLDLSVGYCVDDSKETMLGANTS